MKSITLLGSTGSIGTQTLEVVREKGYSVIGLCAGKNASLLEAQVREFHPAIAALFDEDAGRDLKVRLADTDTKVVYGEEGILEAASFPGAQIFVNAMTGMRGIRPTVAAMESGKTIAMANKEPLVAAGELILQKARDCGVKLLPVDSEHSAVFQCLDSEHNAPAFIKRLIITASGGPFFGKSREELKDVTPEMAVAHPTWHMGAKISVDSATLMNKGLEVIEAVRLFGVPADKIDVTVHRQSIVHSMVEFTDGSILGQMGNPNMKHCIQFALTYPKRESSLCTPLDFTKAFSLTFDVPDEKTFRLLPLARKAVTTGGNATCVLNGAGEEAVSLFLERKIGFLDIADAVEDTVNHIPYSPALTLDDIEESDALARAYVRRLL